MTAYTSTRVGPPTNGFYQTNDTYTDANGVDYLCVQGGWGADSSQRVANAAVFVPTEAAQSLGAKSGATVSVQELGDAKYHQTVFTITALPLTILNAVAANQASGLKIYDYPRGRILVLGATASLAETTTSTIASTLTAGKTCKFALGSTIGVNATLATTEVDHLPATSITSSATINVAGATAVGALAASAQFDGTTTGGSAKSVYLNFAVPTDGDLAGDATITLTGTVTLTWVFLGDY